MNPMESARGGLRERVASLVRDSLVQICGGGLHHSEDDKKVVSPSSWSSLLEDVAKSTISFPNKVSTALLDGKPYDIEVRASLSLFHQCAGRKRKRGKERKSDDDVLHYLTAVSSLGVRRTIQSPQTLAEFLCRELEEPMRIAKISHDVRSSASGIICIVSVNRAIALRDAGRFPCPKCVRWCKGEKGLWWHQMREHGEEHSVAMQAASSEQTTLAIIPYNSQKSFQRQSISTHLPALSVSREQQADEVFEFVKGGDLGKLERAIKAGYNPRNRVDRNGSSLLLWAAGCGHLNIVQYLVETCHCCPHFVQRGKRSFSGRTALHWSSRNGHLAIVQYLVDTCRVDIDATTADGTTAFCWASWQGHVPVMKFLHARGADVQKSNSFGCNAVLWCAQGKGTPEAMKWLQTIGLNIFVTNSNGHSALHKAAQRGRMDLCEWLFTLLYRKQESATAKQLRVNCFDVIGPDSDGCCPSDLAGIGTDDLLASCLVKHEMRLAKLCYTQLLAENDMAPLPEWLHLDAHIMRNVSQTDLQVWEPFGGVRRIQASLHRITRDAVF